jgi:hypothetical protein
MVQMPVPPENRNAQLRATVWRKSLLRLVLAGNTQRIQEAMDELMRAFVSDYLAANIPKQDNGRNNAVTRQAYGSAKEPEASHEEVTGGMACSRGGAHFG